VTPPLDASICVITYRRPEGLARLLDSIARLKQPEGFAFEVVVVDNDPSSDADAELSLPGIPVRRFRQSHNRIATARDRAVREARGHWVAFVDDDEELHEDWLVAYHQASERWPDADAFLGPVEPCFEQAGPAWLDASTFFDRPHQRSGSAVDPQRACTANTWLRRRLFDDVAFESAFDRTLGEDVDLFLRLSARGARILWCEEARVVEWVPPHRHRALSLLRRSFESGGAHAELLRRHGDATTPWYVARSAAVALLMLCAVPIAALAGRRPALMALRKLCVQLGRIGGFAGRQVERAGR
jgi:succinoglycan biosynthesis protein ExoM